MPSPITTAQNAPFFKKLGIYAKLSGPGWIQAAVTLGGGSLVGALYLGVIGGYEFMWLQPLAMLCGIIMLSAISHVTLSSKERPFVAAKKHISPVLAWAWLIATIIADVVYCSAQYGLGTDAVQNNLGFFNGGTAQTYTLTGIFTVFSLSLLWMSLGGGKASKSYRALPSKGSSPSLCLRSWQSSSCSQPKAVSHGDHSSTDSSLISPPCSNPLPATVMPLPPLETMPASGPSISQIASATSSSAPSAQPSAST